MYNTIKMKSSLFIISLLLGTGICLSLEKNLSSNRQGRIFGGYIIKSGQVPYHVFLKYAGIYHCGGALITYQHVITAAHCLERLFSNPHERLTVVAGTIHKDIGGFEIAARNAFIHPQYIKSDVTVTNDLGVIKLEVPFTGSPYISVVALPTRQVFNGEYVTVTGFGRYSTNNLEMSPEMKTYTTMVLDNAECLKRLPFHVSPSDICDHVPNGNGICAGDSGSPLVNAQRELVGIASKVIQCGENMPNMYSSVFYNLPFIYSCLQM